MEREEPQVDRRLVESLNERIAMLALDMEKIRVAEYVDLFNDPKRLLYLNFLAGLARGLGMTVGFTVLGAVAVLILRELVVLNLPLIGGFIAEVVRMVQTQLGM
ncbi:conserved hypothetical protein [Heliomicrobium modesticaldum Ice1]|uniref:Uncharacterized protein n=1 Tax=Heliobacterium modesticaldum (strain ATCC 51547 / Ice1) TaxID=498761 RepID=B0TGP6_HELMI|nr:DUF5665 domain-containing protein [Heliomicrobium modesticaldum]ABZ84657.1 conserved hypothetical protein [Heliomicrobium modesticaldum Ice1]